MTPNQRCIHCGLTGKQGIGRTQSHFCEYESDPQSKVGEERLETAMKLRDAISRVALFEGRQPELFLPILAAHDDALLAKAREDARTEIFKAVISAWELGAISVYVEEMKESIKAAREKKEG